MSLQDWPSADGAHSRKMLAEQVDQALGRDIVKKPLEVLRGLSGDFGASGDRGGFHR